ncbi:MAG: hypothetical protein LUQ60_04265 [Methanomicrobiales archaeon]|nr:hypothetical protein [Methanomicrobiales archaeon]
MKHPDLPEIPDEFLDFAEAQCAIGDYIIPIFHQDRLGEDGELIEGGITETLMKIPVER